MSKKKRRKRKPAAARNPAKNFTTSQNSTMEIPANTPPRGSESDVVPSVEQRLSPSRPNPREGFQPLDEYWVNKLAAELMRQMKHLAQHRKIPLDFKYWERITRKILGHPSPDDALVIPAPAGSGKSTWILAFLLALKILFQSNPKLEESLVGVVVILQKVEDINALAETVNEDCPDGERFMVPLQGWNFSGQRRGFCRNPGVDTYAGCLRSRCPYAEQCQIRAFHKEAPHAPIVGLTQARFEMLRDGDLSSILERYGRDEVCFPRRFILFDEKYRMAPVAELSVPQINEASTEFTELIRKFEVSDARVRGLQVRLNYSVMRAFQSIRKRLCTETNSGICDIPVGFLTLTEEEMEDAGAFCEFRDAVIGESKRLMSKSLAAVLSVMYELYQGGTCLFTKINGFCIYRHSSPQLHFGDCQTLMFDATAEVDEDYCALPCVEVLSGNTPEASPRSVVFHLHTHRDLNVSKSAMKKPWKLPAFSEYIASLVEDTDKPVFLCTYKECAVELADRLKDHLAPEDFSKVLLMPDRDEPTIPYFNGTNGSNAFKDAETVIILGYPRLDPSTYLSFSCAAYGQGGLAAELAAIPEERLLDRDFSTLDLPLVRKYVAHHLAARLEQEIYRCAQRNPGFAGEIHIHLFCPSQDVLDILLDRISGEVEEDSKLPDCVERCKGVARRYENGNTSFGRLVQFLENWDGTPVHPGEIQEQLEISPAVWKDLMKDGRVQTQLEQYGVQRSGRGTNARWQIPRERCA